MPVNSTYIGGHDSTINMNYTMNITVNGQMYILQNMSPRDLFDPAYRYGNQTISAYEMEQSPFCFSKSYFVWYVTYSLLSHLYTDTEFRGFSSIVLYVILGLQIVWTFGMYCVWLDTNIASELVRSGRTVRGPLRAAADLVEAMNETLGHEYCAYTDKEIEKALKRSGDRLRYSASLRDHEELLHVGLTAKPEARVLLSKKMLYGAENKG